MTGNHRVLIANRGEIAIRIARAAASMTIETVGVHAAADARSLHNGVVDRSVEIGAGRSPVDAYLDIDALVAVARAERCTLVHPGYGFLSESAAFAQACEDAGLRWVGPTPETLAVFGDKVRARALAVSLGVPVTPGSDGPVADAEEAAKVAADLGYPVMLKAAAGGGGRGMRAVSGPGEVAEAFERCRSEAQAAFGDGSVFVEKLVVRPRHIEVQVLGDGTGEVVHLHDRDCSVQLRHQKVVEIAPAPGLDDALRSAIAADALALARATHYRSAGTFEFLVDPERQARAFIEGNARIQVEHTVTEQVTGIDLVEAQLRIAVGASLLGLGLGDQDALGAPRGFAVQARVVATGPGTITAYREPSGPNVRVDACGYAGLTPPPQFDPLLAKVVGSGATLAAALDRTYRALSELQTTGLPNNVGQLQAILLEDSVRAGDARTTLLAEAEALVSSTPTAGPLSRFLDEASPSAGAGSAPATTAPTRPAPDVPEGGLVAAAPMASAVVAVEVAAGDAVAAGQALAVVSAMKMETVVSAPAAGTVAWVAAVAAGDAVAAGEALAVVVPGVGASVVAPAAAGWEDVLGEVRALQSLARARLAPGSTDPGVVRQRDRQKLTCRERIDLLLDPGSFREVGSVTGFATRDEDGNILAFTPANHVGGRGKVEAREVVVCADDFTSRGGHADGAIGAKSNHLDRLSIELRIPSIRLLDGSSGGGSVAAMVPAQKADGESKAKESTGAITAGRPRVVGAGGSYLVSHLGSASYAEQLSTVPVVNLLLGSVVGIGAAKAVLGHFAVMVKDLAQLFVAGPPVVSHAMGYDVTKEDLGGWHIHCRNGAVDNLAETEEEAFALTRRFLSYLPSSVYEPPPILGVDPADPEDRCEEELGSIVPRRRTTTFDVRRVIELVADRGSFLEIGPLWGTDQVVGFVRLGGRPVGVVASDSRHPNGGAMTAQGCEKLIRHLDLCDLFHIPVLNLIDSPGFAVGIEHEEAATIRRGGTWMIAFAQTRVPIFTVLLRRSFGVAGNNFATPRSGASYRVAWPAADVGGIPPEGGIEAAYKRQLAEAADPVALRAELEARIESARGPLGPLTRFQIEEMIDPRETRPLACEWAATAHRLVAQPDALGPRPLAFRP